MDPKLPWYQSAIVRQQIVQIVVAITALLGVNMGGFDVDAQLTSIFAGIAGVVGVWTLLTRLFKPAPNLTATAENKEVELVANKTIPPSPTGKQQGFFRPMLVVLIACASFGLSVVLLPGCAGTKQAYSEARSHENAVADVAYVVAEHYAAVVHEAADLAASPTTPDSVKDQLKAADKIVKPLILGDPQTHSPGLRVLAERYTAVKSAENQAQLQDAIDKAVLELSKLINAVKAARS